MLNKICPDNLAKIVDQLANITLHNAEELKHVIQIIFKKAGRHARFGSELSSYLVAGLGRASLLRLGENWIDARSSMCEHGPPPMLRCYLCGHGICPEGGSALPAMPAGRASQVLVVAS